MTHSASDDVFKHASSRKVTLKNVAAHLGVSTATVSNAFNRPDQLSPALRERVLKAAATLGYYGPDGKARSLRTGESRIIGVVLHDSLVYSLGDTVANEFLSGLAEVLDVHGYTLLLLPGRERGSFASSFNSIADGYLVYGYRPGERMLETLRRQHCPVVTVDLELPGLPAVQVDNRGAAYEIAARALASSPPDRWRPAIVALRLTRALYSGRISQQPLHGNPNTIAKLRLEGYRRALREAGHDPASVPIWNVSENTFETAAPVLEQLLAQGESNLLLCMSDRIALTALTLAERRGLHVPEALRLTGFDGIQEGQQRSPQLTTVHQDSRAKGALAANMILGCIARRSVTVKTWAIYGETCP